jgi:hypothetical protein
VEAIGSRGEDPVYCHVVRFRHGLLTRGAPSLLRIMISLLAIWPRYALPLHTMIWTRHGAPASASHTDSKFHLIAATIAFPEKLPHVCTIFSDKIPRRVCFVTRACRLCSSGDTLDTWNCGSAVCWRMRVAGEQSLLRLAIVTPVSHLQFCFFRRDPRNVDAEHNLEKWTLTVESSEALIRKPPSKGGLQLV